MEKSSNLFVKIDDAIFKRLDALKSEGIFQKFNDAIGALEESQQKLVAQLTAFFFILAPFVFVIILWWGNSSTKKDLDIKKQIIEQIGIFEGNQNALNNISSSYLSPSPIASQGDLDNKIRSILAQNAIEGQKVQVKEFHSLSTSSTISKIEAEITFTDFGTKDFSNFMRVLIENERFKVLKMDLTKNKETSLLQGSLSVMHMGQNPVMPGQ
jgi:hypothetical protein